MGIPAEKLQCSRCGKISSDLMQIDPGMRLALKKSGLEANQDLPASVCSSCYEGLTSSASRGVRLLAEKRVREQNKVMLWKNRVSLVKQARQMMDAKSYADAAVAYEKYLRSVEIVYDLKPGELSPKIFNHSTRSKELTVITSILWDLIRIYDTSTRYADRMQKSANKLAEFAPSSKIFAEIIRKAEAFSRTAKHPHIIHGFLGKTRGRSARCFIATAAFEDPMSSEVLILRAFRDHVLKPSRWGRKFILYYYICSPKIAAGIDRSPTLKPVVRYLLRPIVAICKLMLKSQRSS